MSPTERSDHVQGILSFVEGGIDVLADHPDIPREVFIERLEHRLTVLCDRYEALHREATADFKDCPCACPGSEWVHRAARAP